MKSPHSTSNQLSSRPVFLGPNPSARATKIFLPHSLGACRTKAFVDGTREQESGYYVKAVERMIEVIQREGMAAEREMPLPFAIGDRWYRGGVAEMFGGVEILREVGRVV